MLLEPGPIAPLDPDRELPPRLTFDFASLAAGAAHSIEGTRGEIGSRLQVMAGGLDSGGLGALDSATNRAASEHAAGVNGGAMDLAPALGGAADLDDELAFVQRHFPAENERPPLPGVAGDPENVFDTVDWVTADELEDRDDGGGGGGGGDGGGDGGGGGGGGGARGPRELWNLYREQNPTERPRMDRFIEDNPGDYERGPRAIGLPGWDEFVSRNR